MVLSNNYITDFKNSLNKLIIEYEQEKTELVKSDALVIKALLKAIKNITSFSVPFIPSQYNEYEKNKNIDYLNFNIPVSFEFNFNSFDSKIIKTNLPYIIFKIPNQDGNLEYLSNLIGEKIKGDLIFMVRKIKGRWQLPIKAISISDEDIQDIIIFKNINFKMEINKSSELLKDISIYNKKLLVDKVTEFSMICLSSKENILANKKGLFIAESFLTKENKSSKKDALKLIDKNKNGLFFLNTLYDFSIRF